MSIKHLTMILMDQFILSRPCQYKWTDPHTSYTHNTTSRLFPSQQYNQVLFQSAGVLQGNQNQQHQTP